MGTWRDTGQPIWVFSNLEPRKALPCFRDLKGLLGLGKVMPKSLENLEKLIALMLLFWWVRRFGMRSTGLLGAVYPAQAPAQAQA